jgi:replicative DNA helicase
VQEIGEVTKQLKLAAMRFQVPIMLLAQVNRSPMSRKDTRPQLSDLRDSGSLEQDADVVMFLHHDEVNVAEDSLRLAKHRYGPKGEMAVRFDYPVGRLEELSYLGGQHG